MGNGNCYSKAKGNDKDFFALDIDLASKKDDGDNKEPLPEIERSNTCNNDSDEKINPSANNKMLIKIFDYPLLSDYKDMNLIENYKKENVNTNMMKLVRHITFEEFYQFPVKFIEEMNKARCDFLGFSEKLMGHVQNFELIENKINEITDQKIKKRLVRTKDQFVKTSEFFLDLHQKNIKEERLNELIEIEEFKLPIPIDEKELKDKKYLKKFNRRFEKKFQKNFKIKRISYYVGHSNPEISFLLYITNDTKNLSYLFQKGIKYIGIDIKDNNETILLSLVVASDNS